MRNALIVIVGAALSMMLPSAIFALIFVSIAWTHRPNLSVADIVALAIREIREIILKAGDKLRRKGTGRK